jgi:hypothetical protein
MNNSKQKFDAPTVALLRQALNEVVADRRFLVRKTVTPLAVADPSAGGVRRTRPQPSEKFGIREVRGGGLKRGFIASRTSSEG